MERGKISFARLAFEELSRTKVRDGIGMLAEKRLHGLLKRWILDDPACHEQNVLTRDGKKTRFVADILTPTGEIFEIQTADLYPMRRKLEFYMGMTDHPVTVVHPLLAVKYISWIDPSTGEVKSRKRSPLRETPLSALAQLKPFTAYLGDPRFSLLLPIIEADEYRLLDGWGRGGKRGSHRYELMPMALLDTVVLKDREDYVALFPESLADGVPFLAKDFGKATRLGGTALSHALSVFEALGVIKPCGKKGNATLWCVSS